MYFLKLDGKENCNLRIIWLHGWGATHKTMIPLASLFKYQAENYLLDLAGFGESKEPDKAYGSEDYAKDVVEFIKSLPDKKKTLIVGHSNGGRVCVQLASDYPDLVDGIVLVAGAGIPKKRSLVFKFYNWFISTYSPLVKKIFPFLKKVSFGSSDYKNTSGVMRETFVKVLKEDLTEKAKQIKKPTLLIYGTLDTATPVYIGKKYNESIANSQLEVVKGGTHWNLMLDFNNKTHYFINKFIREKL